jgi:hypothetical protein
LIVSGHVDDRSQHAGISLMADVMARLTNRVQLTASATRTRTLSIRRLPSENLTIRMSMRCFTRWMKAFAKKFEKCRHALALYFVFIICRVRKKFVVTARKTARTATFRGPYREKVDEI